MSEVRFCLAMPFIVICAVFMIVAFWIMGDDNFRGCCDVVFNKRWHDEESP